MARLVLILLIPLVCLAAIIYKLAKARRVVSADDMLISAYAPSLAVRCREDFDLLDARRTRIFPRLSARIMRTYPANVWYGLNANGAGNEACPPARMIVILAFTSGTLSWASDAVTGVVGLHHVNLRYDELEGTGTTVLPTAENDPWFNAHESEPWSRGSLAYRMIFLTKKNKLKIIVDYREPDMRARPGVPLAEDDSVPQDFVERAQASFRLIRGSGEAPLPGGSGTLPFSPPEVDAKLLADMTGMLLRKQSFFEYLSLFADDVREIISYFRR